MATVATTISSEKTKMMLNREHGPYLEQVSIGLNNALTQMTPLTQIKKPNAPVGDNIFRPHVELGTETIRTQLIEDKQRKKLYGAKILQSMSSSSSTASVSSSQSSVTLSKESCLIESTSNSVRVSFLFKQQVCARKDPLEASILFQWMRFLQQQAEDYRILRRKPVDGYSITFLITSRHIERYTIAAINDIITSFASQIDKECSDIKLKVNAQARHVATELWKAF